MKKHIIFALCLIINSLNGAETPDNKSITPIACKWGKNFYNENYPPIEAAHYSLIQQYSFENRTVLTLDDNKNIKKVIAQTARKIDSSHEQSTKYDCITSFKLPEPDKALRNNLLQMHTNLKPSGEFIGAIVTKTNNIFYIEPSVFITLYPQIYELTNTEIKASWPHPSEQINVNTLFRFPTDADAKKDISDMGFDIISYTPRTFNIIIKNKEILKKQLKSDFMTIPFNSSPEKKKDLCKQYIDLFMAQLKENDEKDLIYPCSITEIHLRKK